MPNPFTDVLRVVINVLSSGNACKTRLIKIFSSSGTLVKVIDVSDYPCGKNIFEIDFSGMPKGMYYILYQEGNNLVKSVKGIHL
ncbi:MAG: T9SS type A sorting domain-containing protein [Bacteroidia bacterium]|nr:T9SS type A sorting domain-containing protein [Bacteroidia bacterium]